MNKRTNLKKVKDANDLERMGTPFQDNLESEYYVLAQLNSMSEEGYRVFISKLIPNVHNILGVRMPKLHKFAKALANTDWRVFLKNAQSTYHEELLLKGLVINYAKMDITERLAYTEAFVPKISNWALCDSFCFSFPAKEEDLFLIWAFLQRYLSSDEEYTLRFGVVMIIFHFTREAYLERAFFAFNQITHHGYYVKMAVAWAISIFFVHFPTQTLTYLNNNKLDDFTYNKALQKTIESLRVKAETKALLRSMKRKTVKTSKL